MNKEPHINSCTNCQYLCEDSESEMGYTYYSYLYCDNFEHYMNLKSFPFKKEMPCFQMSYWSAIAVDDEIKRLYEDDMKNGRYSFTVQLSYIKYQEKYNRT